MKLLKRLVLFSMMSVISAMTASAQNWIDVTNDFIVNPNLDGNANGWNVWVDGSQNYGYQCNWSGYSKGNSGVTIYQFVEAWRPSWTGTLGNGWIYQTFTLPKGRYRLSADGIASQQGDASVSPTGAYLYADTEGSAWIAKTPMASADGRPEHFSVEFERNEEANINIGLMVVESESNINWLAATNFRLEVASADYVAVQSITLTPER